MLGQKADDSTWPTAAHPHYGVKEAVFPFNMFPEVDPVLGPEMRSTGEVLGMSPCRWRAHFHSAPLPAFRNHGNPWAQEAGGREKKPPAGAPSLGRRSSQACLSRCFRGRPCP
jgi:hypothetical protein